MESAAAKELPIGTFALHNRSRPPLSTLDVRFEDTPADFVVWTSPAFVDTSQSASSEADLGSRYRSLANDGNWPIAEISCRPNDKFKGLATCCDQLKA